MSATLDQFIELLVRAGVVSEEKLREIKQQFLQTQDEDTLKKLSCELANSGCLTAFQASEVREGHLSKLILGDYLILDRVGQGGMGQVYKARHFLMKRDVAIKLMKPSLQDTDVRSSQRFRREVQTASQLSHRNIVSALDAGQQDGVYFLVMEYVQGKNLARVVRDEGPIPVERAVDFVMQAARGLEHAHRLGVIHRDIKPSNLLLADDGTVKVLDLGLARHDESKTPDSGVTEDDKLTNRGQILGTVDFMAPEQAIDPRNVDGRADIYSLGCTLFYLVTGRPPFLGESDSSMSRLIAHREQPIPSLREVCVSVPPQLESIFQKMMQKRPRLRYPSIGELIIDLEGCARGIKGLSLAETVNLQQSTTPDSLSTISKSLLAIAIVGLLVAVGWQVFFRRTKPNVTNQVAASTSEPPTRDYWKSNSSPVNLLEHIKIADDVRTGSGWECDSTRLKMGVGLPAKLQLAFPAPPEYVLSMIVTRKKETGPFVVGLVIGEHQCFVLVDRGNDHFSALGSSVADDKLVQERRDVPVKLEPEKPTPLTFTVRAGRIDVVTGETPVIEWRGKFDELKLGQGWTTDDPHAFLIGANNHAEFEITQLTLAPWTK